MAQKGTDPTAPDTPANPHFRAGQKEQRLLRIPSVEKILSSPPFAALVEEFGRGEVKEGVAAALAILRSEGREFPPIEAFAVDVQATLTEKVAPSLRRVVNATGVVIHTNLGRSPLDPELVARAFSRIDAYSNLEFDLERGERGSRSGHLTKLCQQLFGCEAAVLTNNNAAATLLLLASVAAGKEVVVSRGELVEIGGGFRVPEIIQQGGAKLREVGTTNKTRAADYAAAAGKKTAAFLRVHRSNFDIVGFTEAPEVSELVAAARKAKLPLLYDEGSGRAVDLSKYGFSKRSTIRELIAEGVDIVTCSTDKLLGATQGGLILGRADLVERCAKHPLMRAMRAGKESYAIIAETLQAFVRGSEERDVPIYRMLATTLDALRARAVKLAELRGVSVVELRGVLGGGTTPTETIPSIGIAVEGRAEELRRKLLDRELPIVARVEEDRLVMDLRTVLPKEDALIATAIAELGVTESRHLPS